MDIESSMAVVQHHERSFKAYLSSFTTIKLLLLLHSSFNHLYQLRVKLICFFSIFFHHLNQLWILQLIYFISLSFLGSLALLLFKNSRQPPSSPNVHYIDMLYMSTSTLTMTGLNSVEMESFNIAQVMVLSIIMLLGGDIFVSMLCLLRNRKSICDATHLNGSFDDEYDNNNYRLHVNCIKLLCYVVLVYQALFLGLGIMSTLLYFQLVQNARDTLKIKGKAIIPFAWFITTSSFVNCGLVPTNENMIAFAKNSGLLLILVPQMLAGNTLFSSLLRLVLWVLWKFTKRVEFQIMLMDPGGIKIQFGYLLPGSKTRSVAATVAGLLLVQVVFFCLMEWNSNGFVGMDNYQKFVAALFQSTNSRHVGQTVVDISTLSPAMILVFVIVMYLPVNTSFRPMEDEASSTRVVEEDNGKWGWLKHGNLSQISYIIMFTIIICIVERKQLSEDPLNFSLLFIVVEVISAYGNVGFSTGYSCKRLLKSDSNCKDLWIGFSGKWGNAGKLMIIFIMIFGRFKNFHMGGGKAWKLR